MSFVLAAKTRNTDGESINNGLHVYGDTKIELVEPAKLNWPKYTRRAVSRYGISKITIPCPTLCVAFAGNNLRLVHELFCWMSNNSPFEIADLVERAYEIHLNAESLDDIEFLICEAETVESGRIVCIKNGEVLDDQMIGWIGSPIAFHELQEKRVIALEREKGEAPHFFSMFNEVVQASKDDSVGGFIINATLRDGEFHFNEYLYSQIYRAKLVSLGESVQLFDTKEDGGYTVEAFELDGCPALSFPQIGETILYTNKYRYPDGSQSLKELSQFYLPIRLDSETWTCIEP